MKIYSTDPKQANYARPEYVAREPDLLLIADEIGGTRTMWARSVEYIRKWSAEKIPNYNIRRVCETFFEGFGRTLSAAVGMLFAKPPEMTWNKSEELMTKAWDNIDGAGTAGKVWVKRYAEAAIRDGFSVGLVDMPSPPAGVEVTGAIEEQLNLRPMWRRYDRLGVINWFVEIIDNKATTSQITFVETATERNGFFGTRNVLRYRDLRLVPGPKNADGTDGARVATWQLRQMTPSAVKGGETFADKGSGTFENRDGKTRATLPISVAYTGRTDTPLEASIPLMGVAWANLGHWQLSTSLRFNSEVAGLAQPTVIGGLVADPKLGPPKLEIGPLVSVNVMEGGDFKWVEPAGTGLERLAMLVLEKLRQIAALGLSFLQSDTRSAETAEAKRLDAAAENATLATAAVGIEDSTNELLEIHAWYEGIEAADAPTLTLSKDFEDTTMTADVMTAYVNGIQNAGLPVRILLKAWKKGNRIDESEDVDKLAVEMGINAQAAADAQARDQAATLALAQSKQNGGGTGKPPLIGAGAP